MKKKKARKIVKKPVVKKKAIAKPKKKTAKTTKEKAGESMEEVGVVTHYFPKVDAAVVKLTKSQLSIGDTIFIKGHTSDFKEKVGSMQLDHVPIQIAEQGMEIGLKVKSKVREHDVIYRLLT